MTDLLPTDDGGFEGEAGVFNGTSSFAQMPININPAAVPNVTIGAWVQITGLNNPARVKNSDRLDAGHEAGWRGSEQRLLPPVGVRRLETS